MSSFPNTTKFDNLLLQSLMGRLQLRPSNNPSLSQYLEDLLFDAANNLSDDDESVENKSRLAKEESKLEKEFIQVIFSRKTDSLKPNYGRPLQLVSTTSASGFTEKRVSIIGCGSGTATSVPQAFWVTKFICPEVAPRTGGRFKWNS